jgi:hypothetical protein
VNCKLFLARTDQQTHNLGARQTRKASRLAEADGVGAIRDKAAYGPNDDTMLSCRLAMVRMCEMMLLVTTGTQCGTKSSGSREGGGSDPICSHR